MRHLASMFLAWARENNAFSKFYATSYIQQELQACKRGLYTLFAILEALGWVTYRNPERGIRISIMTGVIIQPRENTATKNVLLSEATAVVTQILRNEPFIIQNYSRLHYDIRAVLVGLGVCVFDEATRATTLASEFSLSAALPCDRLARPLLLSV